MLVDLHGFDSCNRKEICFFSVDDERLMLLFQQSHSLLHEDVLSLVVCKGVQWPEVWIFQLTWLQRRDIEISWLGLRLPPLVFWIFVMRYVRILTRKAPSSPMAVDSGWLNRPKRCLLPRGLDYDRMDSRKFYRSDIFITLDINSQDHQDNPLQKCGKNPPQK